MWKYIHDFENYQINENGVVKNKNGKIIAQNLCKGGYLRVHLWKNGKGFHKLVNRLVYETFISKIPNGMQVNHIDENKMNNNILNLNLMSSAENNNWGTRNIRSKNSQLNDPNKSIKINVFKYPSLKFIETFPSIKEIERQLKCYNVSKVIKGIYKQEKGYTFQLV